MTSNDTEELTPQPNRGQSWKAFVTRRIGAVSLAIGLGGWILVQLWPHIRDADGPEQVSSAEGSQRPNNPPKQISPDEGAVIGLAGTDTSVSSQRQTLVLFGTEAGATPGSATAQIGTAPSNPQTYLVGALLSNGSKLVEIHQDRVVLEKDGQRGILHVAGPETLPIARVRDKNEVEKWPEDRRKALIEGSQSVAILGGATAPELLDKPTGARSGFIRAEKKQSNGIVEGYIVSPGAEPALFSELGFRAGDILMLADGAPIDGDSRFAAFVKSVGAGARPEIAVLRDGSLLNLAPASSTPQRQLDGSMPPLSAAN